MTQDMLATAIALLISVPGVVGLMTQVRKFLPLPGAYGFAASLLLGMLLNLAAYLTGMAYLGWSIEAVAWAGLIVGLGSAGVYDIPLIPERRMEREAFKDSSRSAKELNRALGQRKH